MARESADYGIAEYLAGDGCSQSFDDRSFTSVDAAVLAQVSYLDFSDLGIDLYSGQSVTIAEAYDQMVGTSAYKGMSSDQKELLQLLASSERFQNLTLSNFTENPCNNGVEGFDSAGELQSIEQFAAVTITYEQNGEMCNYISYRGTDGTDNGWEENFAVLSGELTQSQVDAVAYLEIVGSMTDGPLEIGGHSKGGNCVMFAYLFCNNDEIRDRILNAYLYDSNGLQEEVVAKSDYYGEFLAVTAGNCISPEDSIVGQVFNGSANAMYVASSEEGLDQHDMYGTWEIDPVTYEWVYTEQSDLSKLVNEVIDALAEYGNSVDKQIVYEIVAAYIAADGEDKGIFHSDLEAAIEQYINDHPADAAVAAAVLAICVAGLATATVATIAVILQAVFITVVQHIVAEKIRDFTALIKEITIEQYQAAVAYLQDLANYSVNWYYTNMSVGYQYAGNNPQITLNTSTFTNCAARLRAVQTRVNALDTRLNKLYWTCGMSDLLSLMNADRLTGYSWRLASCAGYLETTASDFEALEKTIKNAN